MRVSRLRAWVASLLLVLVACVTTSAIAQPSSTKDYPSKPIKIIVPYPAGGTSDVLARLIGNDLSIAWKVPVVVENKTGASGMIGNDLVAKSTPDGYTILLGISTLLQGPHMFASIPYDFKRDLLPLVLIAISSNVLVIPASFPANSFEEFIAVVRANPGKYSYGSYGAGTTSHIHGETLKGQAGLDMTHVPYKGGSPLMTDLLGGQLDAGFVDIGNVRPFLKSEKIKMLVVTGEQRLKILPNLRTLTELGYRDFEPYPFFGLYLPTGVPQTIVDKLSQEIAGIISTPANKQKIEELGLEPSGMTGQPLKATIDRDYDTWGKVIKSGNIKLEQ